MTPWEFLDRRGQRRHERLLAQKPRQWDFKTAAGVLFLAGYYAMVWQFSKRALPTENLDLIRDAMLTLGPPVGAIVNALFRSDARDEQATRNTGIALDAARTGAQAALANSTTDQSASNAASDVADAAADKAEEFK